MKMATLRNCESKLGLLLTLLRTHPVEFSDRIRIYIEGRYERRKRERDRPQAIGMDTLTTLLLQFVNWDLESAFQETAMRQIESHVHRQKCSSNGNTPFDPLHSADLTLARFCYAVCRSLAPTTVIETGVAYGVTTSYVLQALAQNRRGSLWSIDLPPLCPMADDYVGLYVPPELRTVWHLERGVTRRRLPGLLARLHTLDLFIHDSLHTRSNMTWEFEMVWPHLRPGGLLIADDVQDQPAFQNFVAKARPQFSAVVTEERKDAMFGVAVKGP
jgi:hypothetical protein